MEILGKLLLTLFLAIPFGHSVFIYATRWMEIMASRRLSEAEKRKPLHITSQGFLAWLKELGWTYLIGPIQVLKFPCEYSLNTITEPRKEPILFVHGYAQNSSNFYRIMVEAKQAGISNIWAISLRHRFGSVSLMARQVQETVEELCRKAGTDKVTIVAHSMGGLVSRYYIQKLGGNTRVRRLVTIGSPHKGTKIAAVGIGQCAKDMLIEGDFLNDLNAHPEEMAGVECVALYSPFDALIVPYESAQHPFGGRTIAIPLQGHLGLLFNTAPIQVLLGVLKEQTGVQPGANPLVSPGQG